jgi:hypothetical protein
MGQGGGEGGNGMVCSRDGFLMPAKQRNINKIKISDGKLTHGTHIHVGNINGIFWAWRGRNKGEGQDENGHGGYEEETMLNDHLDTVSDGPIPFMELPFWFRIQGPDCDLPCSR